MLQEGSPPGLITLTWDLAQVAVGSMGNVQVLLFGEESHLSGDQGRGTLWLWLQHCAVESLLC